MKKLIVFILIIAFMFIPVSAEGDEGKDAVPEEILSGQLEASGANELIFSLPDETQEYLDELGITEISAGSILSLEPSQFLKVIVLMIKDTASKPRIVFFSILGIILLCSLIEGFKEGFASKSIGQVFSVVSVLCIVAGIMTPIMTCIQKTNKAIYDCSIFMLGFIPVLTGIITASGQPATAGTYNILVFSAAEIVSKIAASTLVPLLSIYLAFCIVGAISPTLNLSGAAKLIKTGATWILGFIITIFVAVLTVQGIVSTSADTVAVKAGKFVVGSFVPIVGGMLSDAVDSVGGCIKLIKNAVGGFGIISALIIFLPVLLESAIWYVTLVISAAISDIFDLKQVSSVLSAAATVISLLITIIICFAVLLIVTTTIILLLTSGGM